MSRRQAAPVTGRVQKRRQERKTSPASKKDRTELQELERKINQAESEKLELEKGINDAFAASDYREGKRLSVRLEKLGKRLQDLYDQWMTAGG